MFAVIVFDAFTNHIYVKIIHPQGQWIFNNRDLISFPRNNTIFTKQYSFSHT